MRVVTIHKAKTNLSRLIEKASEGEEVMAAAAGAIANAFFDATGVRIRTAPMTPGRVRAVLKAANVV